MDGLSSPHTSYLARWAMEAAVRVLPRAHRSRFRAEWAAELQEYEREGIAPLFPALRILLGAPTMRRQLHTENPGRFNLARHAIKAVFDRGVAAVSLLVLAPLMLSLAVLIRLSSRGPVLSAEERIGRDGIPFRMFRFRTVMAGTDQIKEYLDTSNEPRLTPIGALLRRYSLDVLPELFNVLRGDMSLVGPRPPSQREVKWWRKGLPDILVAKPGLTGLWQISGRSDLSWEEMARLELRYTQNWSLVLDLQILWRTCTALMRGSDKY